MTESAARAAMIEVGRRMWLKGYAAANDGNLSVRLGPDRFMATATGSIKGFLTDADLVVIDHGGRTLDRSAGSVPGTAVAAASPPGAGTARASSEIRMHLAIYEERPDVLAIAHAHPPTATGFATAGVSLDACVLPEIVATLGAIPTAPYATPSTRELADAVRPVVREGHACLLANHGAVAYDTDLFRAYYHLERLEHFASIVLTARLLGGVNVLGAGDVAALHAAVGGSPGPACVPGPESRRGDGTDAPGPDTRESAGTDAAPTPAHCASDARDPDGSDPSRGSDADLIEVIAREVRRRLERGR